MFIEYRGIEMFQINWKSLENSRKSAENIPLCNFHATKIHHQHKLEHVHFSQNIHKPRKLREP